MMIEVSGRKIHQAAEVFEKAYGANWIKARINFKRIIYIRDPTCIVERHYLLTEDEAKRVEAMIGDNGYTYCKALIVNLA